MHRYYKALGGKISLLKSGFAAVFCVFMAVIFSTPADAVPASTVPAFNQNELLQQQIQTILAPKTFQRRYDIVVVTGDNLPAFLGKEISKFRLYAHTDDQFHPIAYQIDERDPEGEYIYNGGMIAGEDVDKGMFDENDELIFICGHAGDRVSETVWPEGNAVGHEIVVTEPRNPTQKTWAYLLYFPENPPAPSKEDYVSYDPEKDHVTGKYYSVGYEKGYALYTDLIFSKESGGNGEDFMDRIKIRVDVQLMGGLVHVRRKESDIRSKVIGWKEGPVRVIRNVEMYFRLLFNIPSPSLFSVTEYYPNYFCVPMRFTIPFNLKWVINAFVVSGFSVTMIGDFHNSMIGGKAINQTNPTELVWTGNTPQEKIWETMDLNKMSGGCFRKEGVGAWCPRMSFPDAYLQYFNIYVRDDVTYCNPPEEVPGEIGMGSIIYSESLEKKLGVPGGKPFTADSMDSLHKGSFELPLDTYIASPTITYKDMKEWLDIRDFPVEVEVSGQKKETGNIVGETDPNQVRAVIYDRRGRKISLRDLFFHVGSPRTTGWGHVVGYQIESEKWHKIPFDEIRRMDFRMEELEPESGVPRPLFIKVTKKDGTVIDLFNAKSCSFAGHINQEEKIFLWNPLIERIELND